MESKYFIVLLRGTLFVPLAALAILAASLLWEAQFLSKSVQWVDHTDQVISASRELMKLAVDMETGVRGYSNTGSSEFLQPYNEANSIIDSKFVALNQLIADNSEQRAQLAAIHQQFLRWRLLAERAVEERLRNRTASGSQTNQLAGTLQSKRVMDSMRAEYGTFVATEEQARNERVLAAHNSSRLATITCLFSCLAIGLFLAVFTRRQMRSLRAGFQEALKSAEDSSLALRKSEELFRTLADSIPQLAWMANPNGAIFWYNQRWFDYTGTHPQQMEGWGWKSVHDLRTLPGVMEKWNASISTGSPFDMVFPLRGSDGVFRPFLTRVMPVKDAEGMVVRWFGTNTDISEQKLVEAELRRSKARLDLTIAVVDIGEWELDLKSGTSVRSLRHDQIYGYESLQPVFTYEMFLDQVLPVYRAEVDAGFKAALISGRWNMETQILRKDGEVRWICAGGRILLDEMERPVRMYGTVMDITKRKQDELRALHLASFAELSPYPIFETDLEGKLAYINPAAALQFPLLKKAGCNHPTMDGWPSIITSFRAGAQRSFVREIENDGQIFFQTIYYSSELEVIRAYFANITEQKQAEEELCEQEERFRSMYENAAVGIKQVAMDGHLLMVNPALCRMLGYSEAELLNMTLSEITYPEDLHMEATLLDSMLSGNSGSFEMEKRYLNRDGTAVWVSVTSSVVRDGAGRALYRISIAQNITDRKRAEDQMLQSQKMEAIVQLAGGVAHDFNTLLGVILGYSELALAELPADDPSRVGFKHIEKSALSGALLTKQLLAFSRKQVIAPQVVDLRGVVTDMEPMLRRLLSEEIEIVVHSSLQDCPVRADPGQLQQVLLNLAVNAGHAMSRGGRLTIDVRTEETTDERQPIIPGECAILTVTDTGIGMSRETAAHIFEPFFTTKPVGKGTGLGLATVYGIVKQSGGDITVSSEPGSGTTFKVFLPRSADSIAVEKPLTIIPLKATGNETILLAEDSAPLRELTREVLTRKGYSVIEAADGVSALEISRSFPGTIDLLITDIAMPRMRGTDLAEHVVQERPNIAVLIMSGYTADAMSHQSRPGRITSLEKPCSSATLLQAVRRVLNQTQLRGMQDAS